MMPKIAIESMKLSENLGRDDAIKKVEHCRLSSIVTTCFDSRERNVSSDEE